MEQTKELTKDRAKMPERLREINRTVLEMELGILALGALFQAASVAFPGERPARAVSLLLGSVMAFAAVIHMYRTLDKALELDEKSAGKAIYQGYVIRYLLVVLVVLGTILTKWLNPLLVFLGYLSLKFTAYLQPLTHKLCNKLFSETDPEPEPMPEEAEPMPEELDPEEAQAFEGGREKKVKREVIS